MDDSMRMAAGGPADDIIARIMSEIEDVIGLIQSPILAERAKRAAPAGEEAAAALAPIADAA